MLSTRFSIRTALRTVLAASALALLGACATAPVQQATLDDGIAVDPFGPVRVALLVPLGSGDAGRERIGQNLVNAAMLAREDLRNATLDIAVYPTAGTSAGGASAASQAIAEGAKIIVGPLFSTSTAGAQSVAAAQGVTILSFSNNATVADANTYLIGNTFDSSASRLVEFGLSRGLSNFGVVYPAGLEGETARDAVAAAVGRRGGALVASQPYDLSVSGIDAAAGPAAGALLAAGADAVVLTDGPTGGLAYIADALRNRGVSPETTQFMGMQRWDISAEALTLPSLQGGVFAASDPATLGVFNGRYLTAYGENPHELAGLAYDAIAAVGAMVAQARAESGSPFSTARITQPAGYAGVNGAFRFLPGGLNQRNLAIYEVRDGRATVIERAARGFDVLGN